jgi:chemotaxis protein methyltransferase CheR
MSAPLDEIKQLIRERLGLRFEGPGERQLQRALEQRTAAMHAATLTDYLAWLRRSPAELADLASLLTINETYFDREPHQLELIVDQLLPRLLAGPGSTPPVRILSLACSSGEEPYSLAMRAHERWGPRAASLLRITGIDVDAVRIAQARVACYQGQAFRALAPERRERWFKQYGPHRFCLHEQIREAVSFRVLNLLDESLAETLEPQHIVLYRNVSIYFDAEIRVRVLEQIKRLLLPEGYLIVGTTEVLANDFGLLAACRHQDVWYFAHHRAVEPASVPTTALSGHSSRRPRSEASLEASLASRPALARTRRVERRSGPSRASASAPASAPAPPGLGLASAARPLSVPRGAASASTEPPAAAPMRNDQEIARGYQRALALVREERLSAALTELQRLPLAARRADAACQSASILEASLLLELNRLDDAQTATDAILEHLPWSAPALTLAARLAQRQGAIRPALEKARRAVYAEPGYWPAHLLLAELCQLSDEPALARRAYATVLRQLENETEARRVAGPLPLPIPLADLRALCRARLARLAPAA